MCTQSYVKYRGLFPVYCSVQRVFLGFFNSADKTKHQTVVLVETHNLHQLILGYHNKNKDALDLSQNIQLDLQ